MEYGKIEVSKNKRCGRDFMVEKYIIIIVFAVLAFIFFSGKGSWLIAGYNTMSDEEREKYNYKRLCRVMGCCMIVIDVLLIISCVIGEKVTDNVENIFSILGIVNVILTVILANTICRKK